MVSVSGSHQRMLRSSLPKTSLQLVADALDDRLEAEPGGHAVLDAADQRQLAALRLELVRQRRMAARVVKVGGGPTGEAGQAVEVGGGEAAVAAVDVGIKEAEARAAGADRNDDAAALPALLDALRPVAQLRLAGPRCFGQPGPEGREQCSWLLAPRQARGGDPEACFIVEQQHRPPGATERSRLGEQALAEGGLADRAGCRALCRHPPPLIDRLSLRA